MTPIVRSLLLATCAVSLSGGCAANVPTAASGLGTAHGSTSERHPMLARQVAGRVPVIGSGRELAAYRPAEYVVSQRMVPAASGGRWKLLATIPGAVIHDISFPSLRVGYAAAELGQIWKTTDGGSAWTEIANAGFPYYWYGITALSDRDVVVSGFNDSNYEGIIRWSHDGGTTWTGDIVLTTTGWSDRVRFVGRSVGLVVDQLDTQAANAAHYTVDGGAGPNDWTAVVPDPSGGWFGSEFSLLENQHAQMSGITYCASTDAGQAWTCGPSIDSVFDGPVFFANDRAGWVGGGEISPSVAGWVHRTTDGGKTWSGRTLNSPFPIRELLFISPKVGWAAGGNIDSNVGGIYFSRDGGQTWTLDLDTSGHEMDACAMQPSGTKFRVWCAGYDSSLSGAVYTRVH